MTDTIRSQTVVRATGERDVRSVPSDSTPLFVLVAFFYIAFSNTSGYGDVSVAGFSGAFLFTVGVGIIGLHRSRGYRAVRQYAVLASPLAAWAFVSAIAAWKSQTLRQSLGFVVWLIAIPGLAVFLRSRKTRVAFLLGFFVSVVHYGVVVLSRIAQSHDVLDPSLRTVAGANRDAIGLLFVFAIPFIAAGTRRGWLRAGGVVLAILVLAATGGRASVVGAILGVIVAAFVGRGHRRWFRLAYLAIAFACVLLLAPSVLSAGGFTIQRFNSLFDTQPTTDTDLRILLLKKAVSITSQHPAFGVGLNNFEGAYTTVGESATYGFNAQRVQTYQAHNTYAEAFASFGIPGGVLYLLLTIGIVVLGVRTRHPLVRGPTGALVGVLAWSLFHSGLGNSVEFLAIALLLAAAMSAWDSRTAEG